MVINITFFYTLDINYNFNMFVIHKLIHIKITTDNTMAVTIRTDAWIVPFVMY